MSEELFTIAIPVYQRYDFFEQAIESALNQTLPCKILVVDNASDHDEFYHYVRNLDNPRVKYHRNKKNLGMVGNWNKCIELSDTPWISILHDDDVLHPRFVESVSRINNSDRSIGLIAGKVRVGEIIPKGFYNGHVQHNPSYNLIKKTFFLFRNLSPFPGVAFKKELAEEAGYFEPALHPVADIYFWYRITCITRTAIINDVLAFYRISDAQESSSSVNKLVEYNRIFKEMIIRENGLTDPVTRISMLWAQQQFIDYYKRTYPKCEVRDLKFGKLLTNGGLNKIMNHVRDYKSYV